MIIDLKGAIPLGVRELLQSPEKKTFRILEPSGDFVKFRAAVTSTLPEADDAGIVTASVGLADVEIVERGNVFWPQGSD